MATVFRVVVVGKLGGVDETRNVFTFSNAAGGLPTSPQIVTWLDTVYTATHLGAIHTSWTSIRWILEEVTAGVWSYVREGSYIHPGTNSSSERVPNQIAGVVVGITESRRRGKKFIAGLTEANVNAGVLESALISNLQLYADAYIAPMTLGAGSALSGVCKADGTNFIAFVASRVDTIVGTQRRRKQGVGI